MQMPGGTPMRLSAAVAGSLSRLQGQLQAAQPDLQNAYAMHWMAMRDVGQNEQFQAFTQNMLWALYGTTALSGMLRYALSNRGTPEVMAGVVDQLHLIGHSYEQAANNLQAFLGQPEMREVSTVQPMVQALGPLDQVYQAAQTPTQTVLEGVQWTPGAQMPMVPIQRSMMTPGREG